MTGPEPADPPVEPERSGRAVAWRTAAASDAPRTTTVERRFLVIGFLLLGCAVIGTRWGVFTPDTRPDLYEQPGRFVSESLRAWVRGPLGLGQSNFNAGAVPVGVVVWIIRTLGASAWLAVRIWRLLLLVVAAWGIRRYLGVLLGARLTPAARMTATIVWIANPYVIVAGSTTPILLPYAFLPWTILALLQAGRRGDWRWPAVFALFFFAQGGLNAGVVSFFQLAAIPAHLVYLRYAEGIRWRQLTAALARCGALSVLVSLYWLAPSFAASDSGAAIASSTEDPADVARTSSYVEVARGLGHWPLYGRSGDRYFLGGHTVYLTDRIVLAATLIVTTATAFVLHRSRNRARILAAGLLATALPIMVGMFPGTDPAPAGRLFERVLHAVPAAMAFRTTNKVGSVAALGIVVAVALGVIGLEPRLRSRRALVRWPVTALAALVLVASAAPMWNGSLYPLDHRVPQRWRQATAELDAEGDGRVLVVPGGTGGNYRWGMRSPDDLFPSHLQRPVVSRNTVVGAADPAGNLLTWFDTELQQGTLPREGVSTMARYLGADRVLNRNDVLSEETEGAGPGVVSDIVAGDRGLNLLRTHGQRGVDTIPGSSGPADRAARQREPRGAELFPIEVYEVTDPLPEITLVDTSSTVLVDGDGAAFAPLVDAGILEDGPPIRYVGDLDGDDLERVLTDGARLVLTDTNQRRAWDINRLRNASSPVLRGDESVTSGSGPSITLWPDRTDLQTVADTGDMVATITSNFDSFGIRPWGKPTAIIDGDPRTLFWTGGIISPIGGSIEIGFAEPTTIGSLSLETVRTEPAHITELAVTLGDRRIDVPITAGGGRIEVPIDPVTVESMEITVTGMAHGLNPIAIAEVILDGGDIHALDRLRMPRGVPMILEATRAPLRAELLDALAETPIDVIATRLLGSRGDSADDEEVTLDRIFELPVPRSFSFRAELDRAGADPEVVGSVGSAGSGCHPVAMLDGEPIEARLVDDDADAETATGSLRLEGCHRIDLDAGEHELSSTGDWRLDRVHLTDGSAWSPTPRSGVEVRSADPTEIRVRVPEGDGPRYLRTGIGFDPRWRLEADGRDLGPPITLDGHAAAWRIGADAAELRIVFPVEGAVGLAFTGTGIGLAVTAAIAFLPALPVGRRRTAPEPGSRRDDAPVGST